MKKSVLTLVLVVFTFLMALDSNYFVPGGFTSSGIGTSSNSWVGIGTNAPGGPLEIAAATAFIPLRVKGTSTGASWSGRIITGGPSNVFLMGQYNDHAGWVHIMQPSTHGGFLY